MHGTTWAEGGVASIGEITGWATLLTGATSTSRAAGTSSSSSSSGLGLGLLDGLLLEADRSGIAGGGSMEGKVGGA